MHATNLFLDVRFCLLDAALLWYCCAAAAPRPRPTPFSLSHRAGCAIDLRTTLTLGVSINSNHCHFWKTSQETGIKRIGALFVLLVEHFQCMVPPRHQLENTAVSGLREPCVLIENTSDQRMLNGFICLTERASRWDVFCFCRTFCYLWFLSVPLMQVFKNWCYSVA